MEEFTKEKEVGSISKVLSLKPPAFYRKPDESWAENFPSESFQMKNEKTQKTPEEILSLSSQERREKATNGLLQEKL